jgi:hypothetical protein
MAPSVRQFARPAAHVVRLGIVVELNGADVFATLPHGPGHAVHPVHDRADAGQNNREGQTGSSSSRIAVSGTRFRGRLVERWTNLSTSHARSPRSDGRK